MTTIEKKWSTIKDNKYWVKALYRQMITEYSKLDMGDKTKCGVTITPLFMNTLRNRFEEVCKKTIWI